MSTRAGSNPRAASPYATGENEHPLTSRYVVNLTEHERSMLSAHVAHREMKDVLNAHFDTRFEAQNAVIDTLNAAIDTRPSLMERVEDAEGSVFMKSPAAVAVVRSRDDLLRAHSRRWDTYTVCPPEWNMTPHDYRRAISTCSPGISLDQAMLGVLGGAAGMIGSGYALSLMRGTQTFEWLPVIAFPAIFLICLVMMVLNTAERHKTQARLEHLDPALCVEVASPEALVTVRGLTAPLDRARKDDFSLLSTTEGRQPVLTEAYRIAQESRSPDAGKGEVAAAVDAVAAGAVAELAERRRRWTQVLDRFETVDDAWAGLLTDPMAVLEHARLLDVSSPATGAFIEAHGHARDLIGSRTREVADVDLPPVETLREIETAVRAMGTTWADAKVRAQRAGYEWMPEADRKRARRATGFLAQAADKDLDWTARVNAAEKALALMRAIEVVPVPQPILRELAAASALPLPPGSPDETTAVVA